MKDLLRGDVGLVTGAARGNGLAIARGLAQAGAAVAIADVDVDEARAAAGELVSAGFKAVAYPLDVTAPASCRSCAAMVMEALGPVSILVNNAGILARGDALGSPGFARNWDAVMRVNVDGCINMVQATLDQLRKTKGRIVNLCSTSSYVGSGGVAAYVTSKGAVLQMTKALAIDLGRDGIRVNGIAPGRIKTRMTEAYRDNPEVSGPYMARAALGRYGEPEEMAGPVVFLASAMSSYITGTVIPVDGGWLAA